MKNIIRPRAEVGNGLLSSNRRFIWNSYSLRFSWFLSINSWSLNCSFEWTGYMLRHVELFEFEECGCIWTRLNQNIENSRPILEHFEYLSINSARKIMLIGFKNKIKIDIFIRSKDLKNNSGQFENFLKLIFDLFIY